MCMSAKNTGNVYNRRKAGTSIEHESEKPKSIDFNESLELTEDLSYLPFCVSDNHCRNA
jgi:hypothetical protein